MKKEITVPNDGKDKTLYLREILEDEKYDSYQFTQGGSEIRIHAEGDLTHETDVVLHPHLGQYGVLRIDGRKDIEILGKSKEDKTILYTKEPAIEEDGEKVIWSKQSLRQFFNLSNNDGVTIKNIRNENSNTVGTRFPDFGDYKNRWEFEHSFNIRDEKNLLIQDCESHGTWGDGFKIEGTSENIVLKDCKVSWNGRQGIAVNSVTNLLIDNVEITNSRRGGIDLEPNSDRSFIYNAVVKNCYLKTWLLPFPMGGRGTIDGALIENNTYWTDSPTTMMRGDGENFFRKNIIFRGNTALKSFGSSYGGAYILDFCENILIENEVRPISMHRNKVIVEIKDSKNIVIRNNDFQNAQFIKLINTEPSEVTVYGNKQPLSFIIVREGQEDEIVPITEYDVATQGEPSVPETPTGLPFVEVPPVVIEPETPVEEVEEEEEEVIEAPKPIETDAEAVATMARLLAYVKKNFKLISIVAIAVIVILIFIL